MPLSYKWKNCIRFNYNTVNSLPVYDIAQNYKILHIVVRRLSKHNLKILNHRHIQNLR
jgi:hypothetical protein